MKPNKTRFYRLRRTVVRGIFCIGILGASIIGVFVIAPGLAASGVDQLRAVLGDAAVAQIETVVFQTQDAFQGVLARTGVAPEAAPWVLPAPSALAQPTVFAATPPRRATTTRRATTGPRLPSTPTLPAATQPTPTLAATWMPAAIPALGALPGAGQWAPYIQAADGQTIAYRTFIQPDAQRSYAVAAIVAFDLQATRLHFVLGTSEPASKVKVSRTGRIPQQDALPGVLVAAFNGGFKTRHGQFGAMVDQVTVVPPRQEFGTVALYQDGSVKLGAWGSDIAPTVDMVAWRQNGPLVIQHGQVNPHTADTASRDWGIILNGATAVWRSGLGLSADGRTLYYVAGTNLTLPALVQTLGATSADNAIQLDINTTMVHFDKFTATDNGVATEPLLKVMQSQHDDRFLGSWDRDYFYVTLAQP